MTGSEEFQQHLRIILKFICCGFYMTKNVGFILYFFAAQRTNLLAQNVNELEFELPTSRTYMKRDNTDPWYSQTLFGPTA